MDLPVFFLLTLRHSCVTVSRRLWASERQISVSEGRRNTAEMNLSVVFLKEVVYVCSILTRLLEDLAQRAERVDIS